MKGRFLLFFVLITSLFSVNKAVSQNAVPFRFGSCRADSMSVVIDSLSIVPNSFSIVDISPDLYQLDPIAARLYLRDSSLLGKTLAYSYQVYDIDFSVPFSHKPLSLIERNVYAPTPYISTLRTVADIEDESRLLSSGSIARGVSVGNNQDLVLNSALNLQLVGNMSEDVRIVASISDKNIPIQPEGNTQYLTHINNIFITLYYMNIAEVNAGDVEMPTPSSQFLVASRNLLGMHARTDFSSWKKWKMNNALGGGVAKGRYIRQKITVSTGVQGPYRLYGENNEMGIVIIAGSERVYVDGVLLVRGQDRDYTIDYNTAEITFTPSQMMTAEKRVFVEFEYADRHYTRYSLFSYNEFGIGEKRDVKLRVNFFQEQDLKNQSIQPELSLDQKQFLSALGDDLGDAYYVVADSAAYTPDRILYCMKDTMVDGVVYPSVYEYSTDAGKQLFSLSFTYMGPNKGSYVLLRSTSNGRVFGWVAPENGMLKGDYNPVLLLSTPKLVQMATVQADYHFMEKSSLKTEFAFSNYDQNLFSKKDDRDNAGFAYTLNLNHDQPLKSKNDISSWRFLSQLDWQYVHKNFHPVESFRDVEFAREYNLTEDFSSRFSEQMLHALVGFSNSKTSTFRYSLNWFSRITDYSAVKQELFTTNIFRNWQVDAKATYLRSKDSVQSSNYWTANAKVSKKFGKVVVGATDMMEYNLFKDARTDSVRANSFAFNEAVLYVNNGDSSLYKYGLYYKNRIEYAAQDNSLSKNLMIHEANALFQFDRIKNQHFSTKFTYRCQQLETSSDRSAVEHYFLGNVEYVGRFFKNAIILNTYYETGSGMEQRKNFSYLKVAKGQGTHVWNDYNGNGIEEIDEFEVAPFQDEAEYVKIWLTSADYVNTYNNQFSQSVQLRPAAVWANKAGFRRFVARFSDVATLRTQLKHERVMLNPFYSNIEDTSLVGRLVNLNNTFSFNNSASKFAFDFVVQKLQNKNLLYYGYEVSSTDLQQVVLKSRPSNLFQLRAEYTHSVQRNQSEFLSGRTYSIERHGVGGSFILLDQKRCSGKLSYAFDMKNNLLGEEWLKAHDVSASFEYRMAKRGTFLVSARYVAIKGDVPNNTAVSYQMLNGLAVGHNALWNVSYQMSITDYLQLSLQYDGRASEGHKVVHTGSLILKAQF